MDNLKAQKYLLIGFEKLVETYSDQLLPKAAHILKSFYDNDILEEEAILEWADKVGGGAGKLKGVSAGECSGTSVKEKPFK